QLLFYHASLRTNDTFTGLVSYDITTSTSSPDAFAGFEYTPKTASHLDNLLPSSFDINDQGPTHLLNLIFGGSGLTAAGATLQTDSKEFNSEDFPAVRFVMSGSVVPDLGSPVPEPSSLLLGGIAALARLGAWAWRRRAAR